MMITARIGSIRNGLEALNPIENLEDAEHHRVHADGQQVRHPPEHDHGERSQEHTDGQRTEDGQADDAGS